MTSKAIKTRHETNFLVMPKDLNSHNTLFGGKILAEMDLCGSHAANKALAENTHSHLADYVFVKANKVEFYRPARQGDLIYLEAEVVGFGETSINVDVKVFKSQGLDKVIIADGIFTYVSMNRKSGKKVPHNID